jgi:hypothetical protein
MDLQSGVDFTRLNILIGYEVANDKARPRWNEGDFFGELFGIRNRAAEVPRKRQRHRGGKAVSRVVDVHRHAASYRTDRSTERWQIDAF